MHRQILGLLAVAGLAASVAIQGPAEGNGKREWVTESTWTPYSVGGGVTGACGRFIFPSEFGVAISAEDYQQGLCNRIVSLRSGEKHAYSQILDICQNCKKGDLNITQHLYNYFQTGSTEPIVGEWELAND
ncbi:hypothetical protein NMY22_g18792 [Coprinellus aureogranulatus]|nr:hypothetical protein NMY22_g18792 [Coprinellus aureogranulatus]